MTPLACYTSITKQNNGGCMTYLGENVNRNEHCKVHLYSYLSYAHVWQGNKHQVDMWLVPNKCDIYCKLSHCMIGILHTLFAIEKKEELFT